MVAETLSNANNGSQDFGEPGIANATVRIYLDADNDNTPDSTVPFATQLTDATVITVLIIW